MLESAKNDQAKMPDKYSINLMWINKSSNDAKPYLGKYETEQELVTQFLDKAIKWQKANPTAEVNIWYDSQFATPQSIKATQDVLDKVQKDLPSKVKLKDIREIPVVKNNPDVFTDYIPIYYRVDLLKLIVNVHEIENGLKECAIFTDLEVGDLRKDQGRMSKEELFNPQIMQRLQQFGVQGIEDSGKVENQFIQLANNPKTVQAFKIFINVLMQRATTALNHEAGRGILIPDLARAVFNCWENELLPFIGGTAKPDKPVQVLANLFDKNASKQEWINYDLDKHGLKPFGNVFFSRQERSFILEDNTTRVGIKYPQRPVNVARTDLDTRSGNDHFVDIDEFADFEVRSPADGTNEYKCSHLMDLKPQTQAARQSATVQTSRRDPLAFEFQLDKQQHVHPQTSPTQEKTNEQSPTLDDGKNKERMR